MLKEISSEKDIRQHTGFPFEIPDTWAWVKLADLYEMNPKVEAAPNTQAAFIPMENISAGFQETFTFDVQPWNTASKNHTRFADGDVAFAKISPCFENRKSFIADGLPNGIGGGTTELIILRQSKMLPRYTYYVICDQRFIKAGAGSYKGIVGQQRVKADVYNNYLVAVPPFAEQCRIVARIDSLFSILDNIDALQARYVADAAALKSKLIDAGIRGLLTERLPEDGAAEEIYQQIQEEKMRLVGEGKIKKAKPLPEIKQEEVPFDVPKGWKWVRFLSVVDVAANLVSPEKYLEYLHIAPDNIEKGTGRLLKCKTVREDHVTSANHLFHAGQIIYSKIRPLLNKVVIAPSDGLCSADMYPLETKLDARFVQLYMLSDEFIDQIKAITANRVLLPKINKNEMQRLLLPLPPLAEQRRIVARLNELLPLCEN